MTELCDITCRSQDGISLAGTMVGADSLGEDFKHLPRAKMCWMAKVYYEGFGIPGLGQFWDIGSTDSCNKSDRPKSSDYGQYPSIPDRPIDFLKDRIKLRMT